MEHTEAAAPRMPNEAVLWESYGRRIFRYLLSLTGHRETAEDLAQETFLRAIRDLRRTVGGPENESAWLFRIATNLFRDHCRRRRLISWLPFLPERHGGSVADASEALAGQDLVGRVLRTLPAETRTMLLLRDAEGFSTQEIAGMMGMEYEAARKRLARARIQFRERYQTMGGQHT